MASETGASETGADARGAPLIPGADPDAGTAAVRNRLLLMLLLAYTVNFMDRTIVGTLAQRTKLDLKIMDAQPGLLSASPSWRSTR